ncbi:hypothetical protein K488DRAFT_73968 [Vararia minispora EC-137]|uniref:Uncharacterized protein n=1 Tax=Vararia minispora EC-137 TaxID=1314806 RepID=A0ACB8Q8Q8_9AGAM|nr:hypothetical protein K488DRAFT_73968 [Vararia minispora EC-137]
MLINLGLLFWATNHMSTVCIWLSRKLTAILHGNATQAAITTYVEAIKAVLSHNELLIIITLQSNIQHVNNILMITLQSSPSPLRPPMHATALGRASTTSVSQSLWSEVQVHRNLPHMPLLSVTTPWSLHRLCALVANDECIDPEVREIRWVTNSHHSMVCFHLSTDLGHSLMGVPAVGNLTLFERQNPMIPNGSVHHDNRSE